MPATQSSPRQTVRPTRTRFTPRCPYCYGEGIYNGHECYACCDPCESCSQAGHPAYRCPSEIENEDSGY